MDVKRIVTEIQSLGVRVPGNLTGREGGAGPSEGRALVIGETAVNVPIRAAYTADSPFSLAEDDGGGLQLLRDGEPIASVSAVPDPRFYEFSDADGVGYRKIALLHGTDCIATTVLQRCFHWRHSRRCAFCATEVSLERGATIAQKTPEQLGEVVRRAAELDGVRHAVLTTGVGDPPGSEIDALARCAAAVKAAADLPVHVQFSPPPDLDAMERLLAAGVDTVGIHIECFDRPTLQRVAPAKAALGLERYEAAWRRAVALFGVNQVSSFLIAGLGEPPESIVSGSEVLADLGVYPYVVPLRPVPGSWMQNHRPPEPDVMEAVYEAVAQVLRRKGLSATNCRAGCVRCGACSALALYEVPAARIRIHTARNEVELDRARAIRHAVFVEEQGLFAGSDRDEHDDCSIHLVAEQDGRVVGTVRVFPDPERGNGHWIGSRLAVDRDARIYRIGAGLVREAMRRVKKKGCTVFTAHIQEKNVHFFQKLGWTAIGPTEILCGHPHRPMQADLDRVPDDGTRSRTAEDETRSP
ncbi:MAG: MSMEG_0568 family radical SAM protein [Desulfobacteraceae bacterium]|nr:MSMEG_0568 family radical SAM protein [Desulfobacteraceae bacterium]